MKTNPNLSYIWMTVISVLVILSLAANAHDLIVANSVSAPCADTSQTAGCLALYGGHTANAYDQTGHLSVSTEFSDWAGQGSSATDSAALHIEAASSATGHAAYCDFTSSHATSTGAIDCHADTFKVNGQSIGGAQTIAKDYIWNGNNGTVPAFATAYLGPSWFGAPTSLGYVQIPIARTCTLQNLSQYLAGTGLVYIEALDGSYPTGISINAISQAGGRVVSNTANTYEIAAGHLLGISFSTDTAVSAHIRGGTIECVYQ